MTDRLSAEWRLLSADVLVSDPTSAGGAEARTLFARDPLLPAASADLLFLAAR
jgi:hypothetical protein